MSADKAHELRDVNLTGAARGVWLVKVPKYLSEKWKETSDSANHVGKLKISKAKGPTGKPDVIFSLSDDLAVKKPTDTVAVPKDHKFVLTGLANQNLSVLSRTLSTDASGETEEKLTVEGRVIQRAECRPIGDANYMKLKRSHLEMSNKPHREVVQLKRAVVNYKPRAVHDNEKAYIEKKKEEGKKSRMDEDVVKNRLFSAFEKHQYYNVKDLVALTQQPVTYLKEILKDICIYNMKAPHRNMWELRPEYRHYKSTEGAANDAT